ncbi:hypothetical protein [Candidatus Wolbachia massiliensis]|uniref:Uncharacterized protein n=1 Tax=Candidatus Wolbachia massiliensis TaxID=1845000 RepID=A0A7L7YL66_9RICK|nr:hypothetical protein [Candidatus Wolbachia massiliensis]QOD37973.1 hypothetical protein ID128_03935 [Candidatus Wolbachia massiliensis]
MLSDIIKQAGGWDTKALAKIFSGKKLYRSVDGDKEKHKNYLTGLVGEENVFLPKEIIPDSITLDTFVFTCKKDPLTLPVLLRYFAHKNLIKEAKDDLDKINQKLQGVMDEELKELQKRLQEEVAELRGEEINTKQDKIPVTNSKRITETSSKIKVIELYKKDTKNLLSGEKAKIRTYPEKYYSILNDELTKVMEEKLKAYVENDKDDVEKTYHSLNSKAEKINILRSIKTVALCISFMFFGFTPLIQLISFSSIPIVIMLPISAIFLAAGGVSYLTEKHFEQGLAREMEDFIEGPKHVDKATNTGGEDVPVTDDLIKLDDPSCDNRENAEPSAPPSPLYPDLPESLFDNSGLDICKLKEGEKIEI